MICIPDAKLIPEVATAYPVVWDLVADLDVYVDDPHVIDTTVHTDPIAIVAGYPPAYQVRVTVNPHMVCVSRTSRYGLGGDYIYVDWPVPPGSAGFADRLAEVLLPVVHAELATAAEDRASVTDDGPIEARDAVQKLG